MRNLLNLEIHTSCHSKKKEKLCSLDDDHDAVLSGRGLLACGVQGGERQN